MAFLCDEACSVAVTEELSTEPVAHGFRGGTSDDAAVGRKRLEEKGIVTSRFREATANGAPAKTTPQGNTFRERALARRGEYETNFGRVFPKRLWEET
jgi:hypothetical protein